jgi:hypothetical protein
MCREPNSGHRKKYMSYKTTERETIRNEYCDVGRKSNMKTDTIHKIAI